jgi:hypothetical protein
VIRSACVQFAAASTLLVCASAWGAGEQPGILWETRSQTVMDGVPMQMPVQTQKLCTPREWTRPPAGGDPSCTQSDFKRAGDKATWTVECSGQMKMSGTGEITFSGTDSYTGLIKLTSGEMGGMTVKLSGRRLGGCDDPR